MPEEFQPDYPDPKLGKPDPKRRYLCRHIHAAGQRCGSPAVRGRNFCFYHGTARRGFPASERKSISDSSRTWFTFQHIDTRADVQLALFDVLSRIATNDLDTKRAGLLLYASRSPAAISRAPATKMPSPHPSSTSTTPTPTATSPRSSNSPPNPTQPPTPD